MVSWCYDTNQIVILAAVDNSKQAHDVMREAQQLGADLHEPVDAIHVLTREMLVSVAEVEVGDQPLVENYEVEEYVSRIVTNAVQESSLPEPQTTVRVGDPADEIASYASEADARYIVIGGGKRSATGKALFGSVTQRVIFQSPVPVLTVGLTT